MQITKKDKFIILADDRNDPLAFADYLERAVPQTYEMHNLVIDLLKYDTLNLEQLVAFLRLSNYQRGGKKSYVIVNSASMD